MRSLIADFRHSVRLYARTPVSSIVSIGVLAVAIAVFTAFLSLYVDLVLRPHPAFERGHRIATIGQSLGDELIGIPFELAIRIGDEMSSIESAAAVSGAIVLAGSELRETPVGMVSEGFFSGLQPRVALGRGLSERDHGPEAEPVVVISHAYWQQQLGGNADVLDSVLELTRSPSTPYRRAISELDFSAPVAAGPTGFRIVGVMADSRTDVWSTEPAIWVPFERAWPIFAGSPASLANLNVRAYIRPAAGASVAAVAAELRGRYGSPDAFPTRIPGSQLDAVDGIVRSISVKREAERQLALFLAGSVLIALVAAANVSLFLLARAPGRRRELAIRMAVGASTGRLARQLVTEASLLVIVAASLGLVGSVPLSLYLQGLSLFREAEWRDVTLLDWRVLLLASTLLLLLTALVSLAPILRMRQSDIAASSHETMTRASVVQRLVGTLQMGVAGTLGGAAIAFAWYFCALLYGNFGYETGDLFVVDGAADIVGLTRDEILVEFARRREAIEALPAVTAVAYGSPVPGGQSSGLIPLPVRIQDPDDAANSVEAYTGSLDDRFIQLLGFRLIHGRAPDGNDHDGVLVNQALARSLWGREDVVGERLPGDVRWNSSGAEVLGVLEDVSFDHPSAPIQPYVFTVLASPMVRKSTVIEADLTAAELQEALDRLTEAGTIEVQVSNVRPLSRLRSELIGPDRARGLLTIASAGLVVLLAAYGFYGTQRYLVAFGQREYAIRASLGSSPAATGRLVIRRGLLLGVPGLALGSLLSFITVEFLRDNFVSRDISPGVVMVCTVAALFLLLLAASVGPAHAAKHSAVARSLRAE